jgi:hypothetical protein
MLIRKVLAGVGAVMGLYIASALQNGPDQVDANVCKLARRIYSSVSDQCMSAAYDNWGTAAALTLTIVCVLILLWDFRVRVKVHAARVFQKMRETPPSHLIIAGLVIIVCGMGWWQLYRNPPLSTSPAPTVVREAPSADDITKAAKPLLDDLTRQRDDALRQRDAAIRERDIARQSVIASPAPPQQSFATTYDLSPAEIVKLAEELSLLKPALSDIEIQRPVDGILIGVALHIGQAFDNGGIRPNIKTDHPLGPKDAGISIRVGNLNDIPQVAREISIIFKKVIGIDIVFTMLDGLKPGAFAIFVGRNPNG